MQEEQDVQKARITQKEKEPLPVEENQDRASYVNKQWRIVGLVSDKGKPLNGQTGTVVDYDTGTEEARLHWRLEAGGKIVKVNPRNLQALEEVFDRKEMSVKEIAAEMVARERASFVDKPWRIVNLTSYKGRQLNNRECWVRDFDTDCQARLHCEVQGEVELVKLRAVNLEAIGGRRKEESPSENQSENDFDHNDSDDGKKKGFEAKKPEAKRKMPARVEGSLKSSRISNQPEDDVNYQDPEKKKEVTYPEEEGNSIGVGANNFLDDLDDPDSESEKKESSPEDNSEADQGCKKKMKQVHNEDRMPPVEKRGAHLRKENRNNPDYVSAGKKKYVPTGKPRGRKPTGYVPKPYVPKKGRKKNGQGAHLRMENRNNPNYVSAGKKKYVPIGKPRGRHLQTGQDEVEPGRQEVCLVSLLRDGEVTALFQWSVSPGPGRVELALTREGQLVVARPEQEEVLVYSREGQQLASLRPCRPFTGLSSVAVLDGGEVAALDRKGIQLFQGEGLECEGELEVRGLVSPGGLCQGEEGELLLVNRGREEETDVVCVARESGNVLRRIEMVDILGEESEKSLCYQVAHQAGRSHVLDSGLSRLYTLYQVLC